MDTKRLKGYLVSIWPKVETAPKGEHDTIIVLADTLQGMMSSVSHYLLEIFGPENVREVELYCDDPYPIVDYSSSSVPYMVKYRFLDPRGRFIVFSLSRGDAQKWAAEHFPDNPTGREENVEIGPCYNVIIDPNGKPIYNPVDVLNRNSL